MIEACARRASATLFLLVLTSSLGHAGAGEPDRWTLSPLALAQVQAQEQSPDDPQPAGWYRRFFELSLSTKSVDAGYRAVNAEGNAYFGANFLVNDDGDLAVYGRFIRQGAVVGYPVRLGAGASAYAVRVDDTEDDALALALTGIAEYDLPTVYRTTLAVDLSMAPDITTVGDAKKVIDARFQVNLDIGEHATAFVGYRLLEVETDGDGHEHIEDSIHVGVRLAF